MTARRLRAAGALAVLCAWAWSSGPAWAQQSGGRRAREATSGRCVQNAPPGPVSPDTVLHIDPSCSVRGEPEGGRGAGVGGEPERPIHGALRRDESVTGGTADLSVLRLLQIAGLEVSSMRPTDVPRSLEFWRGTGARVERILLSGCIHTLRVSDVLRGEVDRTAVESSDVPALRVTRVLDERSPSRPAYCPGAVWVGETRVDERHGSLVRVASGSEVTIGAANDGPALRLRLGTLSAELRRTPLQERFRLLGQGGGEGARPLWTVRAADGLWGLAVHPDLPSDVREELRVAADARLVSLSVDGQDRGDVTFAGQAPSMGRVPDRLFADALAARFGERGAALAPTASEAREALGRAKVCLPSRYDARAARTCVDFIATISSDLAELRRDSIERTLWLERTLWRITARGPEAVMRAGVERARVGGVDDPSVLPWVVSVGDRVGVEGDARGLFVCDEQGCEGMGGRGSVALARAGLHELREAPSLEAARTASARTVGRWVVVDPWAGWIPVGLWPGPEVGSIPWARVARDDERTFAFERRVHALVARVAVSARSVAVWSRGRAEGVTTSVLSGDVGVIASDARGAAAPSGSALVLVLSRDEPCPDGSARAVRERAVTEPESLPPGSVFHVLLAQDRGGDRPLACLATARMRVRPRRAIAAAGSTVFGALGDPRVAWLTPWDHGGAIAVMVPAMYLRTTAGPWFATELALVGSAGFAPGRGAADALGAAILLDARAGVVTAGVAMFAPRWSSDRAPQFNVSPFLSLDVGALYEMAGGR
jgi:hypothetical protein